MKEAMLYGKLGGGVVKCGLCSHGCMIYEGKRGLCGVRENRGGTLYSLVYGKAIADGVDPIEKKPFFHFMPGSTSFSIATAGCNFRCKFCQNWEISQNAGDYAEMPGKDLTPADIVAAALKNHTKSIAYTYTEPTVFFEYAFDTSVLAKKAGLSNLFVTNGFMTPMMLDKYSGNLDAANVDLKSFSDRFYREICSARLEPVLDSLKKMKKQGVWVEVTTLLIPSLNDSEDELRGIAEFISSELGKETPWHISRFHPDYKLLELPSTNVDKIHLARRIGLDAGLRYVYSGNVWGDEEGGENTYCYSCGKRLISREGFSVSENLVSDSKCPECGAKIDGVNLDG